MEANQLYLFYGAAIAGLVLVLARVGRVFFRLNIHAQAFTNQIVKLIEAGNLDRAHKLASVVPAAPVAAATGALIKAWQRGAHRTRSLKDAVERDLGGIPEMVGRRRILAVLGAIVGLAVVGYARESGIEGDPFTHLAVIGGAAVVLALYGELKASRIRKDTERIVETVIGALKRTDTSL